MPKEGPSEGSLGREEGGDRRRPLAPDPQGEERHLRRAGGSAPEGPARDRHLGHPEEGRRVRRRREGLEEAGAGLAAQGVAVAPQEPGAQQVLRARRGGQPAGLGGRGAGEARRLQPDGGRLAHGVEAVGPQRLEVGGDRCRRIAGELGQAPPPVGDLDLVLPRPAGGLDEPAAGAVAAAAHEVRGGEEEGGAVGAVAPGPVGGEERVEDDGAGLVAAAPVEPQAGEESRAASSRPGSPGRRAGSSRRRSSAAP